VSEIFRQLSGDLRTAVNRPTILAYVPHEKQISFHSSDARGRQFIGGNRSGKTVGGATEAIWWATGRHPYLTTPPPPVRGRVVAVDFLEGVDKIVAPEVARWLPKSELRGGSWDSAYQRDGHTLHFANGSFIEFMSYEQSIEKFAGTSRHFIWFDEEPPEDIFTECLLRLLDTGGSWWMTMTPVEGMTWTYDNIYERSREDPNLFVVEVDTTMNPHVNPGEIEILLAGLTAEERKARLHGQYVQRGGLIYPSFREQFHVIKSFAPRTLGSKWLHFAAMDHGINNPTAWLWMAVDEEGRIVVYDEHYQSGWVVKQHASAVLLREASLGIPTAYRVGDPSIRNTDPITGTSVLLEYIEHGVPIVLGNNDVPAGLNLVRTRLGQPPNIRPSLFITQNCTNLIWEMKRYRWQLWASKKMDRDKNKKEEPNKKDDHACDALRYGVASRPRTEDHSLPSGNSGGHGVPAAANPYSGVVDPGVRQLGQSIDIDPYLGEDY
jgi:phage terminase large subunit-like protein